MVLGLAVRGVGGWVGVERKEQCDDWTILLREGGGGHPASAAPGLLLVPCLLC